MWKFDRIRYLKESKIFLNRSPIPIFLSPLFPKCFKIREGYSFEPSSLLDLKKKMKYDPQGHHRRSIRLKDYDYSQTGA